MEIESVAKYPKSEVAGMGAIATETGVSFRVWAPNAQKVFVMGDSNDWGRSAIPLVQEENGYWSVDNIYRY